MRRPALALFAVVCLLAPAACSKSSGSKEKFCAAIPRTGDLMSILSDFSSSDSASLEKRFDDGLRQFRALEKAAPREIRGDVSTIADTVERVLDVVRRHPDDLSAIRTDLAKSAADFAASGKSALRVGDYARTECGISLSGLDPTTPGSTPGATTTTTG